MSYRRHKMMKSGLKWEPVKFDILTSGTVTFNFHKDTTHDTAKYIAYSMDGGDTWTTWTNPEGKTAAKKYTLNVVSGDEILWKGDATCYAKADGSYVFSNFGGTATFDLSGNIMSLLGDNFLKMKTIPSDYCFRLLFYQAKVVNASGFYMPAKNQKGSCYRDMFSTCAYLTTAPQKLIKPTASLVYFNLFSTCSNLVVPPILTDYTTNGCYQGLFYKCTSLETAPILPYKGSSPGSNTYRQMFDGCTKLNYVMALMVDLVPATNNSLANWLNNVAAEGIFVKNINATWTATGASGVPTGWTIIYYDTANGKYYLDQNRSTECDDHGNVIN